MDVQCGYQIGDIVEVADKIDPENQPKIIATVKYIEQDNEIPSIFWIYLVANEEVLNTNMDPTLGYFWEIFHDDYEYMRLVSRATVS